MNCYTDLDLIAVKNKAAAVDVRHHWLRHDSENFLAHVRSHADRLPWCIDFTDAKICRHSPNIEFFQQYLHRCSQCHRLKEDFFFFLVGYGISSSRASLPPLIAVLFHIADASARWNSSSSRCPFRRLSLLHWSTQEGFQDGRCTRMSGGGLCWCPAGRGRGGRAGLISLFFFFPRFGNFENRQP